MKKIYKSLIIFAVVSLLFSLAAVPALALTESEVQSQVDSVGKEAVTGNVFVWFLCAIAFLKVSQKIDSFMSSLGINVGHTGGSMLAEAMILVLKKRLISRSYPRRGKGMGAQCGGLFCFRGAKDS